MDIERQLKIETEAAKDLISILNTAGEGDDADLVADMIDGETEFVETIAAALDKHDATEAMIEGLDLRIQQYGTRKTLLCARRERLRAAIEQAMYVTGRKNLPIAVATLSLRDVKPGLMIDDESTIPAEYWTAGKPKLDKKALAEAAKLGPVPGTSKTNGGISLAIRRK